MLASVFFKHINTNFFEMEHHFITMTRFLIRTDDNTGTIICETCKDWLPRNPYNAEQEMSVMGGNEHFTLPGTMVYSILELQSVWCKDCKKQLFKWYTLENLLPNHSRFKHLNPYIFTHKIY